MDQGADEILALVVGGMGFPREDDLHGPFRVQEDPGEPFRIAEQQFGAFIGGEAAGKRDGQHLGIEGLRGRFDLGIGRAAGLELRRQTAPREVDQPFAAAFMGAPELRVGHLIDVFPYGRV